MNVEIVKKADLSNQQINDVLNLYKECNKQDNTAYVFDPEDGFKEEHDINTFLLYEDSRLAASVNIFVPTKLEAEIVALTRPDRRKNGYFNLLLQHAKQEIKRREIKSILFVCDSNSQDGLEAVSHLQSNYEYSEFLMEHNKQEALKIDERNDLSISVAELSDKDALTEINGQAFDNSASDSVEILNEFFNNPKRTLYSIFLNNQIIGMIGVYDESTRKYIHGFCIDSNFRRQGIGKYVLGQIVHKYRDQNKKIVLEVQTDNSNALKVYKDAGFSIVAEFRYNRMLSI